jgi:hypothetical protein
MPKLIIDLQEGFKKDQVTVRVGDRPPFSKEVSTRNQTGLAERIELELPSGTLNISVDLPARRMSATQSVDVDESPFVSVTVTPAGKLILCAQREPFRYA